MAGWCDWSENLRGATGQKISVKMGCPWWARSLWKLVFLVFVFVAVENVLFLRRSRLESGQGIVISVDNLKTKLENRQAPKTLVSETHEPRTLVSYVMYAPLSSRSNVHVMCNVNADLFVSRAVAESSQIDYVFSLVGDTSPTDNMKTAAQSMSNVNIVRVPNQAVDLLPHMTIIKLLDKSYKNYILLNCGARGPYFHHKSEERPLKPSTVWTGYFTDPLRKGASAVGSTISLEISPHIQTYAMALNSNTAQFAISYWERCKTPSNGNNFTHAEKLGLIANFEVGLSSALLKGGFTIASLDSRMQHQYSEKSNFVGSHLDNPTVCKVMNGERSPGCIGVNPCEVLFVKYGGEALRDGHIPSVTVDKFESEDRKTKYKVPRMCDFVPPPNTPFKPNWDITSILKNISTTTSTRRWTGVDTESDIVIIVRVHSSYSHKLMSLLWMLQSSAADQFKQVRVLVIPTDEPSVSVLRQALDMHWDKETGTLSSANRVRVSLMEFPPWLYQKYGVYLAGLCTQEWKSRAVIDHLYPAYAVARYCDVNSPLHYLLVDLALHFATTSVTAAKWVITTNADNFYSPGFFEKLSKTNESEYDVVMSNMLTRGVVLDTRPLVGSVDLGAYAVSMLFVRRFNAGFLSSLPVRAGPEHYHNADGHFMEYLVSKKARVKKITGFFFIHN